MSLIAELVERLDSKEEVDRIYAAEDIGYAESPDGVPPLVARLPRESSRAVRAAIFQALERLDCDVSIEALIGLLLDDDPHIRNQAVDVLRKKGARSTPWLKHAMESGDKDTRKLVLDVLAGMDAGDCIEIYQRALLDPDQNIVITAVENLGKTRRTGFRSAIEELLSPAAHPMLTSACLEALAGLGVPSSINAIHRHWRDASVLPDFLLPSYLRAIAELGDATELVPLASLLEHRVPHLWPSILSAIAAVHRRHPSTCLPEQLLLPLQDIVCGTGPPLTRYQALRVLPACMPAEVLLPFLLERLNDDQPLVRLGAIQALNESSLPEVLAALSAHASHETHPEVLQALRR